MPLILNIRNVTELTNGSPTRLVLDRRGATIGRAATSDWVLPDPALHISSRHCEISFLGDRYELIDHSTNGTFLLGEGSRLAAPRIIDQGDVFLIGDYEIEASLDEESAARLAAEREAAAVQPREWQGWNAAGGGQPGEQQPPAASGGWGPAGGAPAPSPSNSGWGAAPASPPASPAAKSGWGPTPASDAGASGGWGAAPDATPPPAPGGSSNWGPAAASPAPPPAAAPPAGGGWEASGGGASWAPEARPADTGPVASPWNAVPQEQAKPASGWSSPVSNAPPSESHDIWGKIAQSNVVDWARGGFGKAAPAAPASSGPPPGSVASAHFAPQPVVPAAGPDASSTTTQPPGAMPGAAPPAAPPPAAGPAAVPGAAMGALATAAGIEPGKLKQGEAETIGLAGDLLRRLISGLVVMLEARARAKAQLGAQGTSLEFDGNNPLKFARTPEQALAQLLNPPQRGFMGSDRAIEDAFKDLQAHQMATLMAMQGALRATLDRFSPAAIRSRAENTGLLAKVLHTARDAELWKAYEKEFSGVAQGSDEAFMDVFAKEFKKAYEAVAHQK